MSHEAIVQYFCTRCGQLALQVPKYLHTVVTIEVPKSVCNLDHRTVNLADIQIEIGYATFNALGYHLDVTAFKSINNMLKIRICADGEELQDIHGGPLKGKKSDEDSKDMKKPGAEKPISLDCNCS